MTREPKTRYTDSRGWRWRKQPDREAWALAKIGDMQCYGDHLHIWVGFDWFGDGKWHVGQGGGPRLDRLFDTAREAMEAAYDLALQTAREDERRARALLGTARRKLSAVVNEPPLVHASTYSITLRPATQDELERCDVTSQASLIDGAFSVLRDGGLIAITNEYGTAVWTAPEVDSDRAEVLVENATGLWT